MRSPGHSPIPLLTVVLLCIAACGGNSAGGGQGAACADVAGCGDACTAGGGECGPGLYCASNGACSADCTMGGGQCASDEQCTADGQCEPTTTSMLPDAGPPGSQPDAQVCASVAVELTPEVPTVMLVIDRSSSMNSNISPSDANQRWASVKDALINDTDGIVKQLQDRVVFGATLYSAIRNSPGNQPPLSAAPCPRVLDAASVGLNNFDAIKTLLTENNPAGGTPTEESVRYVTSTFPPAVDGGPRILLLATDGDPDTCNETDTSPTIQDGVEDAVEDAFNLGIQTFVLSVGSNVAATHLQKIANEGVGQDRATGTATVFLATTKQELKDSFDTIIQGARSCELDLNGTLDTDRAGEGTVTLNGTDLTLGADWEVVDNNTIRLIGTACDTFRTSEVASLSANFPCDVVVIVE